MLDGVRTEHLDPGVGGGFLLQPHEQRGLAVAPRTVEHDLARRGDAVLHVAQHSAKERLLGFPAGQIGRQPAGTRSKRPLSAPLLHAPEYMTGLGRPAGDVWPATPNAGGENPQFLTRIREKSRYSVKIVPEVGRILLDDRAGGP